MDKFFEMVDNSYFVSLAVQSSGVMGIGCAQIAIIITMPRDHNAIGLDLISFFFF